MSRFTSFLAGFLCCLFGFALVFFGLTKVLKTKPAALLNDNNSANTHTANPQIAQNSNNGSNRRTIVSTNRNNNGALPTPQNQTTANNDTDNYQQSVNADDSIQSNQMGTLMAVHGIGGNHLTAVPSRYTQKNEQIHKNVLNPTLALIHAAERDGIRLFIVSAYRSYHHQKSIWERKWGNTPNNDVNKAREILRFSSFPGTSRHHWGTDVDFNSVNPSYWESGEGRRIYNWLRVNAPKYGFCQTYAPGRTGGYSNEAWHWSHMPTAQTYYRQITEPQIFQTIFKQNVKGSQAVNDMGNLMSYVTTISTCSYSNAPISPVSPKNNDNVKQDNWASPNFQNSPKNPKQRQPINPENKKPPLGNSVPSNAQQVLRGIDVPANEFGSSPNLQNSENGIKMSWGNGASNENQ